MKNLPVKKKKMGYYTYWELDRTIQNSVPFDGFFGRDESIFFEELFQNLNVIQCVAFSHKDLPG